MKTIVDRQVATAADLLTLLMDLRDSVNLAEVRVTNGDSDAVGSVTIDEFKRIGADGVDLELRIWLAHA